jgi:[CysO sulfur-carrier protein]-S-L-cysteine hydrolase
VAVAGQGPVVAAELDELVLDRATFDALVEHARSDFPYEVCGLLGIAADGTVTRLPITNAERSMTYYSMEPRELLRAMRTIEDEGWGLVIHHSHTHTHAYPSATDIRLAAYPEALYLIVTLQDRDAPAMRAYTILDGEVAEVPVRIA